MQFFCRSSHSTLKIKLRTSQKVLRTPITISKDRQRNTKVQHYKHVCTSTVKTCTSNNVTKNEPNYASTRDVPDIWFRFRFASRFWYPIPIPVPATNYGIVSRIIYLFIALSYLTQTVECHFVIFQTSTVFQHWTYSVHIASLISISVCDCVWWFVIMCMQSNLELFAHNPLSQHSDRKFGEWTINCTVLS